MPCVYLIPLNTRKLLFSGRAMCCRVRHAGWQTTMVETVELCACVYACGLAAIGTTINAIEEASLHVLLPVFCYMDVPNSVPLAVRKRSPAFFWSSYHPSWSYMPHLSTHHKVVAMHT
jgi:hypothetical protein